MKNTKREYKELEAPENIKIKKIKPSKSIETKDFEFCYSLDKNNKIKPKSEYITFGNGSNFEMLSSLNNLNQSENIKLALYEKENSILNDKNILKEFLNGEIKFNDDKKGRIKRFKAKLPNRKPRSKKFKKHELNNYLQYIY